MRIKSNTLTQIFNEFRNGLDELGGLLGAKSKGNVIEFVVFDKGTNSNAPKYYTSGSAIRAYGGNTVTISSNNTDAKSLSKFGLFFSL